MKDNHTKLGELYTLSIQDFNAESFEIGQFHLEVEVPTPQLIAATDKRGFIIKTIAAHLASAITDTEVPSHLWVFETDPRITRMIPSIPKLLPFGR